MRPLIILLVSLVAFSTASKCTTKAPPLVCSKPNEVVNPNPGPCVPGRFEYCYEYLRNQANECDTSVKPVPNQPRCDCKKNYLRNDRGECVKQSDCCDDPNASVVESPDPCPLSCENRETHDQFPCLRPSPIRGCACNKGYLLGPNNKCIRPEECITCGENEVLNPCAKYCTFDADCARLFAGFIPDCPPPPEDFQCGPRCECKPGLVRSGSDCVSPDTCCPVTNEISVDCPADCDMGTNGIRLTDCKCFTKGCRCKPGFLRDPNFQCVEKVQCKINEEYKEGTCDPTCANPDLQCKVMNHFACFCLEGYVRDENGECIPKNSCPIVCGENEEFTNCLPINCPPGMACPQVCRSGCKCKDGFTRKDGKCAPIVIDCGTNEEYKEGTCDATCQNPNKQCKVQNHFACFCLEGHFRNYRGECVTKKNCPIVCAENEEFSECLPNICPPGMKCPQVCRKGCKCKDGFTRKDGKCVPIEITCGANEQYREGTCDGTCQNPNYQCKVKNRFACFCIPGYVRNEQKQCVSIRQCPINCVENEVYSNCVPCLSEPDCPDGCRPGCKCKGGFRRNDAGSCVEIPPLQCKEGEVYNPCVQYCTFDATCPELFSGLIRSCPAPPIFFECGQRCECKPGLVRIDQDCVPEERCCEGPNEVAVDCPADCDKTLDGVIVKECQCFRKGCRCKPDFVRDGNGKCVKNRKPCGSNEVYKEGTCDGTCENPLFECGIKNHFACFCLDGYVRNDQGQCIAKRDCPLKCGKNEELADCVFFPCPPGDVCTPGCRPGCRCIANYRRDDKGICVQVPPLKCNKNEVLNPCVGYCFFDNNCAELFKGIIRDCAPPPPDYQCSQQCVCKPGFVRIGQDCVPEERCCSGDNERSVDCPAECDMGIDGIRLKDCECFSKGCRCKPGFLRDSGGTCIRPKCDVNEEYKLGSCDNSCANPNASLTCKAAIRFACFCLSGYVRNIEGKCIEKKKCPSKCGKNEEYTECLPCTLGPNCVEGCMPGCKCVEGYQKNDKGRCLKILPPKCKKNEVLNPCAGYCTFDDDCLKLFQGIIRDCARPPPDFKCGPRCDCKKGLVRINGDCVSPEKCCEGPNEVSVDCPAPCDKNLSGQVTKGCTCFIKGCRCKPGFVRNTAGKCVKKTPALKCKKNETYTDCGSSCPIDNDCLIVLRGIRKYCLPPKNFVCGPRCDCLAPFVRIGKECLPTDRCCSDPNQELVDCPAACDDSCSGKADPDCKLKGCVKKGCRCKAGYVKSDGKCIKKEDCDVHPPEDEHECTSE